jgi:hypothetical protein
MKQRTRIKVLSILFVITGLLAGYVSFRDTLFRPGSSQHPGIAVDTATLQRLTFHYQTQTTVLNKGRMHWLVNEKYKARPNLIQLMKTGLAKAEVKRPVADENKKRIAQQLQQNGILVKAETASGIVSFLVAPNDNDANSSYYMAEGSQEPFVIFVPGFSGDMTNLFRMDESGWRSRIIFNSTPMSLQGVAVSYPTQAQHNFSIQWNSDRTFSIGDIQATNIDTAKVINYLAEFEQIGVEAYIYEGRETKIAALQKNAPQAIIDVKDLAPSATHRLLVYGESKELKGIYGIVEPENDLVVLKPEVLFSLLVRKEFFEKKKK